MTSPHIHEVIVLESVKHDGSLHRRWEKNTIIYLDDNVIVGYNDRTPVKEPNKQPWHTDVPAIFYFDKRYWFNVVFILEEQPFYYCNLSSPFTYSNGTLQYVDYDLDVIVKSDGTYKVVDEVDYELNKQYFHYPIYVHQHISEHLAILLDWIQTKKGPFNKEQFHHYYELYRDNN